MSAFVHIAGILMAGCCGSPRLRDVSTAIATQFSCTVTLQKGADDKPIEFKEIEEFITVAQEILKRYYSAYEKVDQRLLVVNVEWEPKQFLEWCRLDDYAEHHRKATAAKMEEYRKKYGQGS